MAPNLLRILCQGLAYCPGGSSVGDQETAADALVGGELLLDSRRLSSPFSH